MESDQLVRVYDVELATPILTKWDEDDPRVPGVDFATGWTKYEEMKLAVLCAPTLADSLTMTSRALYERGRDHWTADRIAGAQHPFDMADVLVSFNGISFDNNVLLYQGGVQIAFADCYDILAEWVKATGKRVKLNDLAEANGLELKSGSGADAPAKWQERRHREVIEYCFDDCRITAQLYDAIRRDGGLRNPYATGKNVDTFVKLPCAARAAAEGSLF